MDAVSVAGGDRLRRPLHPRRALLRLDRDGAPAPCPLRRTDVKAEIAGGMARVSVTQEFVNPINEKIEAVYTFPLSHTGAVDDMTMRIGDRTVRGSIRSRDEAQRIYDAARARGQLASLLRQERPNIFTQAVANIPPRETVKVTITYVEVVRYDEGAYEFVFPMVVGPQYTAGVPDAGHISPPVTPPGTRAGHNVSIEVHLDAGVTIEGLASPTHAIATERRSPREAVIQLQRKTEIPNKDFLLRYAVAGKTFKDAVLAHRSSRGGYFSLLLQPPREVTPEDVTPKELVFALDTSGSMRGFPIEKAKETMRLALAGLYPRDTFHLITFSGDTRILFPEPVPATPENLEQAQRFLVGRCGSGGTEMMKAIRAALKPSERSEGVRIVCFITDGYVGNEREIIEEVRRHSNARVFSFGIGSSVNRFLLDGMAAAGRGEVEYVGLNDDGSAAARRFHERVRNPLLTDVSIEFTGLPVSDVYPKRIPDLFSAKPTVVHGRYAHPARGTIRIRGRMSGREYVREIPVELPAREPARDVLATLWARARVEDLMSGQNHEDMREEVTRLGLKYRLLTRYTAFVAVEETVTAEGGTLVRIEVPVEMPEGVSYEGVFGDLVAAPLARGMIATAGSAHDSPLRYLRPPPPPAPAPRSEAHGKLDPRLGARIADWRKGALVGATMMQVEIWLTDATPEILSRLAALGFRESGRPKVANIRVGTLSVESLAKLLADPTVRYVALRGSAPAEP
ncbi:MAG: VIT and vWA domain-containing protein [Bryobacteraceae bacterium]